MTWHIKDKSHITIVALKRTTIDLFSISCKELVILHALTCFVFSEKRNGLLKIKNYFCFFCSHLTFWILKDLNAFCMKIKCVKVIFGLLLMWKYCDFFIKIIKIARQWSLVVSNACFYLILLFVLSLTFLNGSYHWLLDVFLQGLRIWWELSQKCGWTGQRVTLSISFIWKVMEVVIKYMIKKNAFWKNTLQNLPLL